MVALYELFSPFYFRPLRLLQIFIFTKQLSIQDLPRREVVVCCVFERFKMLFLLLWWVPGELGVPGWEGGCVFFTRKANTEMLMLPGSGHFAFLCVHSP